MSIDKSMNVLIVDDYKTMLRIIRNLLKQIEFNNVEEASDGAEALAKLRAGNFGLVISDWNMVPMTGLQLLQDQRLRNVGRGIDILDGEVGDQAVESSRSASCADYEARARDKRGRDVERKGAVGTRYGGCDIGPDLVAGAVDLDDFHSGAGHRLCAWQGCHRAAAE